MLWNVPETGSHGYKHLLIHQPLSFPVWKTGKKAARHGNQKQNKQTNKNHEQKPSAVLEMSENFVPVVSLTLETPSVNFS